MTAHNDLDRQLNDFLRDGPTELPYESFDAVRDRTEQTRQRVVIGPWRLPDMNKIVGFGLAAAAVVAVVLIGSQVSALIRADSVLRPPQPSLPSRRPPPNHPRRRPHPLRR